MNQNCFQDYGFLTLQRLKACWILRSSPDLGLRTTLSLANLYSWSYPLVFNRRASITTSIGRNARLRGVPNTSSVPLPTTITVSISDRILRGSSRMMQIFQWLVSLSPITSLFGCTTKNILVIYREHPEVAKNILTTDSIQRLKALIYKELMNFFLTVQSDAKLIL